MMRMIIAAIAALVLAGQASAQTCRADLTWTPPTQNTDGSPYTNAAGFVVYWGTSSSALSNMATISNPAATSARVDSLAAATWFFAVTAVNTSGQQSAFSNIATKTTTNCVALPDPRSPGDLETTPEGPRIVFDFLKRPNRGLLLAVGTVPASTVCVGSEAVVVGAEIYYVVPRELVTWLGTVQPDVVYTQCE